MRSEHREILARRVGELFDLANHDAARNLFELNRMVSASGQDLDLTAQEWNILLILGENLHMPTDTNDMANMLYETDDEPTNALVRNHIKNIRPKLPDSIKIVTFQGRGYMLTDSDHFLFRGSPEEFGE